MYDDTKWFLVENRLPNDGEEVLVWFEYYRYGEREGLCQKYGIGDYYDDNKWLINGETGWHKLRVIAWMLLPEPPESKDDAE